MSAGAVTHGASKSACAEPARPYHHHADTWNSDALAALFAPGGVFDRLGTEAKSAGSASQRH